ncbi:MAG: sulfatase-like hydrolase/transferase [Acidobacteriota bacterium]
MQKTWPIIFFILILIVNCTKQIEHKQSFFPETIDGVINFAMTGHTKEDHFSGNWEAPVLTGKKQRKSRKLSKESGTLKFFALKQEKYILETDFMSLDKTVRIFLNGNKKEIEGRKNFLNGGKIRAGKNSLSFIHEKGLKFHNISVYPKRILRIRDFEKLIKDEKVMFLPGSLRFFVRPEEGEHINMKLDLNGSESVELKVLLKGENTRKKYFKKIRNNKDFEIGLLKGEFQEVLISFPSLQKGYLKITESFLVNRRPANKDIRKKTKKIRTLVKNKNLLFILLDATRNDRTGYNGYIRETTPNIDDFSKDAHIFNNCYSEASYTLASTGTLLTGLPPDFHGVVSSFFSALNKKITTLAELFLLKNYFTGAISANPNFGKAYKFNKGFGEFDELFLQNPAVQAEEFLEPFNSMLKRTGEKPFFIYLHLREPHDPFKAPQPYLSRFQNKFKEIIEEIPSIFKASKREYENTKDIKSILGKLYDGNLAYGDMVFGELINILKKRGMQQDTMIVFLSDHGEAIGEHGVFGHGHVLFQQSIRIPLVIKIPGLKGETYKSQVITSDLVRTLTDIFELPYPYRKSSYGRNIFNPSKGRRLFTRSINAFNYPGYTVQQYPYKLIIHFPYNKKSMELFDLEKDPGENNSIKNKPLIEKTLLFSLFNHLRSAEDMNQEIVNPELRKKDLKALESLGYL